MNLYKISQYVNNGYDTYDSAIVAAPDANTAIRIHPCMYEEKVTVSRDDVPDYYDWAAYEDVTAEYIGTTDSPQGVVLSSFNAG